MDVDTNKEEFIYIFNEQSKFKNEFDFEKEINLSLQVQKFNNSNDPNNVILKIQIKGYYLKEYILPSGNVIKIQGYEHFALDELLEKENINEHDIITGCSNVPTIWYNDENSKHHRHYVDIFIPSQNRCIEVKSTWTFTKQKDIVFLKQKSAKELGYLYEIWVYDIKGNKVQFYN